MTRQLFIWTIFLLLGQHCIGQTSDSLNGEIRLTLNKTTSLNKISTYLDLLTDSNELAFWAPTHQQLCDPGMDWTVKKENQLFKYRIWWHKPFSDWETITASALADTLYKYRDGLLLSFYDRQTTGDSIIGVYEAIDSKPDSIVPTYSILKIENNNRFTYKFGCGDIGGEITGTWTVNGKKLKLTNDKKYLDSKTITYPKINSWTILPNGLKPDKTIEFWCKFGKVHLKKK